MNIEGHGKERFLVSGLRFLVWTARRRDAINLALCRRLRGAGFRRIEAIDRLTFVHQVQMIPRDGADVFGITFEQLFLKFEMRKQHPFIVDLPPQFLVPGIGILTLFDLGQKRIGDRNGRGKNDERKQETIERMPDALSRMDL